ncbi:MAG: hypothetical protein C4340_06205 [Armatimonadota bacterium]
MGRRRVQEAMRVVQNLLVPRPGAPRGVGPEHLGRERVLLWELVPAHAARVLEVPSVHVVELVQVQIVAGHDPDRAYTRDAGAEQKDIANLDLAGKAAHEPALELVVITFRRPRSRVPWADEADAVLQEHIRVRPARRSP